MIMEYTVVVKTDKGTANMVIEADTYNLSPTHVIFQKLTLTREFGPMYTSLDMIPLDRVKGIAAKAIPAETPKKTLDLVTQ